jgi:hypothetical protein
MISGELSHRDSIGNGETDPSERGSSGMTAGTGVLHSEYSSPIGQDTSAADMDLARKEWPRAGLRAEVFRTLKKAGQASPCCRHAAAMTVSVKINQM